MTGAPLAGRRVVVTRAAEQADDLAVLLRDQGAEPVLVPLIEIVDPPDGGVALAAALGRLDDYDWLFVTSPNGAARVAAALGDRRTSSTSSTSSTDAPLQIAAVGTATAAALGCRPDLVATTQSADGLLSVFPHGSGRILVAQAEAARPTLVDGLRERGWQVDPVTAYRTRSVRPDRGGMLRALSADAVLFASGSAVRAWYDVFGSSTPPLVVAIGPSTAIVAEKVGLKVDVIATDHSLSGMVTCLLTYLGASD